MGPTSSVSSASAPEAPVSSEALGAPGTALLNHVPADAGGGGSYLLVLVPIAFIPLAVGIAVWFAGKRYDQPGFRWLGGILVGFWVLGAIRILLPW